MFISGVGEELMKKKNALLNFVIQIKKDHDYQSAD